MPYITQERRGAISGSFPECNDFPKNSGELNYYITLALLQYVREKGRCYQTFNDIAGVMDNCYKEFYRRVVAPYEDEKIKLNGDVY